VIQPKDTAESEARNAYNANRTSLLIWSDGSKIDTGGVGAGIAWKQGNSWRTKGYSLGDTKEVFDAELYGIKSALDIANSQLSSYPYRRVTIFSDSQAALKRSRGDHLGPGQAIAT